ncbi:peptide-N4-asparagine amidase [Dyella sp. A6]|uniref:peptide-N4-asparagine amidase n=1 Tax=Dyella aluminiiresistens TaxID=3069105 RepID=UPI002E772B91|nr:peptide-N4-asparagine amidase [Dyella sp. A6]
MTAKTMMGWRWLPGAVALLAAGMGPAMGTQVASGAGFEIGSRVVASAEPPVSRLATKPCVVTLFAHESFDDHGDASSMAAHPHRFDYTPPKGCGDSWSKVVLEADFSVPAGRQFDRTVAIWLGGVNLYFGTTIEPEPDVAQHWHAARDLTDYTALFRQAEAGQMILNNWVSPTTNQPIYADVRLLFYPAGNGQKAASAADKVYPLGSDPRGEQTPLENGSASLSRKITFPRNVERAYLDVIAQSQAHDERWYTCVDKAYLERTRDYSLESFEACDGGSFRGVEVLVDGKPAGLAPVYPWIYTGGVAPHLWLPTPGIQTVNFIPARVDLTPFAGLLDDGQPHTVAVRVPGADHFFNVAANLLVYQDPHATELHGGLIRDTLVVRQPAGLVVRDTLHKDPRGRIIGTIDTDQVQSYVIAGHLHTPRGTIVTTVRYHGGFHNHQTFARPGARRYDETIDQVGTTSLAVERTLDGHHLDGYTLSQRDPLYLSVRKTMRTKGQDFTANVAMKQGHRIETRRTDAHGAVYHAVLDENLATRDHADGNTIPDPLDRSRFAHDEAGSERATFRDSLGSCYSTALRSRDERLTRVAQGTGCPGDVNHLDSRSRPDHPWLVPLHTAWSD